MEDVGRRGRTVLFVSHNMPAIARLCPRTILLDSGGVAADGPSHQVVAQLPVLGCRDDGRARAGPIETGAREPGRAAARRAGPRRRRRGDRRPDIRKPVGIEMEFDVLEEGWSFSASYDFYNEEGLLLFGSIETDPEWRNKRRPIGRYATTAWVPANLFSEGTVIVNVELLTVHPLTRHFEERQAVAFHLVDSMDGDSARGDWGGEWSGAVRPLLSWGTRSCLPANRTPVSRGTRRAMFRSTEGFLDAGRGFLSGLLRGAERQPRSPDLPLPRRGRETHGPLLERNQHVLEDFAPDGVPPAIPRSLSRRASLELDGRTARSFDGNGGLDLR